jgi:hypothetical protein
MTLSPNLAVVCGPGTFPSIGRGVHTGVGAMRTRGLAASWVVVVVVVGILGNSVGVAFKLDLGMNSM